MFFYSPEVVYYLSMCERGKKDDRYKYPQGKVTKDFILWNNFGNFNLWKSKWHKDVRKILYQRPIISFMTCKNFEVYSLQVQIQKLL